MAAALLAAPAAPAQEKLDAAGDELSPGLAALYRAADASVERVEPKPAFSLGHSSPHPRLPPGPFEATWTGAFLQPEGDSLRFAALASGHVKLVLGGVTVLEGKGEHEMSLLESRETNWTPGLYRLRLEFRSLPGVPARLKLFWEGRGFAREPLPAWRLKHLAADRNGKEALAARGRALAGRLGCARCHASAFPGVSDPPPGPSLADLSGRVGRTWLLKWLEDPAHVRAGARMPALFPEGRAGLVERSIVAQYLVKEDRRPAAAAGNHRNGRRDFQSMGCAACHFIPEQAREDQPDLDRVPLEGLNDRLGAHDIVSFLGNPLGRYPDGRMPRIPVTPETARDMAAYVLMWSKPAVPEAPPAEPVLPKEVDEVGRRLRARGADEAGRALVREKRCGACHPGLGEAAAEDVPIRKAGDCRLRFAVDDAAKRDLAAYLEVSRQEKHPSPFAEGQELLRRRGCQRCHARDTDRPPPIEEAGSTLGGAFMQYVPFLRTPRLTEADSKYARNYLLGSIRDGVSGVRHGRFSYRMPAFGHEAEAIARALAEGDGDLPGAAEPAAAAPADPTLHTLGPSLVGFEGYSCVSCHIWNGQLMSEADPGAIGPEMTTVARRIRRDWFDRWMEDPSRIHPGTPMPQIFRHGQPATVRGVLEGDPGRQREAIWAYLSKGKAAPSPKPLPPIPVSVPPDGPLVAQIPVRLPDNTLVESITLLYGSHDLLVYDVGTLTLRQAYTGAELLRSTKGRLRAYTVAGTPVGDFTPPAAVGRTFEGYDRLADGVRVRTREGEETIRLVGRKLVREAAGKAASWNLPAARPPAPVERPRLSDAGKVEGSLERPGYRAIAYPRPKTASGEDLVMPGAIAADPRDGRVFVASMKLGEVFALHDPSGDGTGARFESYGGGLFQEAYSMLARSDGLYVLHRRNLTKVVDGDGDGRPERFDRVLGLPHGVADTYDYAYGLVREPSGAFYYSFAPYANTGLPGAGSLLRHAPGQAPEEISYGFRNPVGWCAGPEGEVYYTDNQGEWVATNKLCHIVKGRYYGFPNSAQKHHAEKPRGKTAVWVPYAWAKSVNGVTYDGTGGKFGPFAGQFFLAELMYGGAIVRAQVERVNGEVQGACFPFWGKGLLGPLVLTFDPQGRMWVGSITEPGWMAQPDRGAVYRIDFTGEVPFEIQSIHVRPRGFRLVFTAPAAAGPAAAYAIEHFRYEHTGAYGSPELDRATLVVERVDVVDDRTVDLVTAPLVKDRVYLIQARGVRSAKGKTLVHPAGAYTLNEIPR